MAIGNWRLAIRARRQDGFTFVELLVVCTILLILASAVMPLAKVTVQRQREAELRRSLREMRTAIDKFKATGRKKRFLRRIPIDPITRSTEWGMRSYSDKPDSTSWGGSNVFDVFTKSDGKALDGTKYKDW